MPFGSSATHTPYNSFSVLRNRGLNPPFSVYRTEGFNPSLQTSAIWRNAISKRNARTCTTSKFS
eukprot:1373205-Amphidinium_carterae.1